MKSDTQETSGVRPNLQIRLRCGNVHSLAQFSLAFYDLRVKLNILCKEVNLTTFFLFR